MTDNEYGATQIVRALLNPNVAHRLVAPEPGAAATFHGGDPVTYCIDRDGREAVL